MTTTAERFMRLFRGYEKRHGSYVVQKQEQSGKWSGKAQTVDRPAETADYEAHLKGERGIGIIPLTADNRCYFAAIDIDEYPVDHLNIAWAIREHPLFVTRSKSNGAHIWLFIPNGASAEVVVRYMKKIAGTLGYGGSEIFPKQTQRASIHDVGNWINLPFFGNTRKGVMIEAEDKKNLVEFDIEDWLDIVEANIDMVTEEELDSRAPNIVGTRDRKGTKEDFLDGPPCLMRIKNSGQQEGGRNEVLFHAAVYFSRKYASADEIESRCSAWNHAVYDPPLPASEVRTVVKSVMTKEYGYFCNKEPMKGFCERASCLRRAFGVGSKATNLPCEITGFSKILTNPPMYGFNADHARVLLPNVRALSNQKEFKNFIIDATSKVMPLLSQPKYDELVGGWLENCEEVEAAPDADYRIQWADALSEFVEHNRHTDRSRLVQGHAWVDEENNLVYFRMRDLKDYMKKQRVTYNDAQLMQYLQEELGVKYKSKGTTVGKKSARLYTVALDRLDIPDPTKPTQEGDVM